MVCVCVISLYMKQLMLHTKSTKSPSLTYVISVKTILRVAEDSHGIEIPSSTSDIAGNLNDVTVHYEGHNAVDDALDVVCQAIEKAKDVYIHDSLRIFRDNRVWFKTVCFSEYEEEFECIILPPIHRNGPYGLLIDYCSTSPLYQSFSHRIETFDGAAYDARLKIRIQETDHLIDPLDFRWYKGAFPSLKNYFLLHINTTFKPYLFLFCTALHRPPPGYRSIWRLG